MVTPSFLRKCALIPLGLLLLGGCGKVETPAQAPQPVAAAPASPTATPAQKSATPNSFDEVTAQLDPGGDFYLYLSTEQCLSSLSRKIDSLHNLLLSGSGGEIVSNPEQAEKTFALIKDIVHKCGIEDVSGFGASSLPISPGLYRNKFFIHHYPDKGAGLFWSIYGKEPHDLAGLDFLPVDTAVAGVGDFDLAQVVNFLRQEAEQSGFPEAKQAVDQWQTQFAGVSGLQLDDVLASLNGALGMVLTLDATNTITVPVGNQSQTIPAPRLALLIAVKNDLVFKQVDKMLGGNPGVIKVDEPDLRMRTMPIPALPALNLRPSVAQWNGYLVIASDDKLIRDMIAVQKGAPGFKSTPEYAALSAGLPQQGNSFGVSTQRFADTLSKFQRQMLANQPGGAAPQAALMQNLMSKYQNPGHTFGVRVAMPDGLLCIFQSSQGSSQLLAPLVILPAAVGAGVALPAYSAARGKALQTKSLANAKQIYLACKMYAVDNNGAFPPTLDALFPTYLSTRAVLVSPLMPSEPVGYAYTPGLKDSDAPDTVLIEDKFASVKNVRIVVHVDGTANITRAP